MNSFLSHIIFGLRLMRKSPIFYVIVILVLALGIGANTAVFSVVDAVLLRKLPFRDPDRLVMIWEKNPTLGAMVGDRVPTTYTNFVEWVQQAKSFDGIAGFEDVSLNRTGTGEPERIAGARVSPNFFGVLGVSPAAGNSFDYVEGDSSHSHAAMLSNGYWKSHFGGNPGVIGQTLTLNDVPYIVVGVLPANFHLPSTREGSEQRKPDIWIPYEPPAQRNQAELDRLKMQVFARLRPGVSLEQARQEMDVIGKRLEEQNPTLNAGFGVNVFPVYVEDVGKELRRNLMVLLSAVGLILLLACANLANLMLTRATARQRELAIRKALGASRTRLIVQMIVEGLLLSFFGCLLAIVVAHFGIQLLLALKPADLQRPEQIHLSIGVLLFTMAIGIVAGVAFAAIPAIYASNTDVNTVLKDSASSQRHPGRLRAALVIGEVSLAFVLLIGAVFMIGSLVSVLRVDPGFRADHLLTMNFSMPPSRYAKNEQFANFCQQVLERVSALPGVKSASFSDGLPMTRIRMMKFTVDGQPLPKRGSEPTADMRGISSPAYVSTLGIPIYAGRNFTADEINNNLPVIVVNQTLAKKLWPNEDAVGKTIRTVARRGRGTEGPHGDRRRRRHAPGFAGERNASRSAAADGGLHQLDAGGAHRRRSGFADLGHQAPGVAARQGPSRLSGRDHGPGGRRQPGAAPLRLVPDGHLRRAGAAARRSRNLRRAHLDGAAAHARDWNSHGAGRSARRCGAHGHGVRNQTRARRHGAGIGPGLSLDPRAGQPALRREPDESSYLPCRLRWD